MPRTVQETKIAGRAERRRLPPSPKPYWRGIDAEVHLGYRRGKRGGSWLVRWWVGDRYKQEALGSADDELGEGTLDFEAALRAARLLVDTRRAEAREAAAAPALNVSDAVMPYIVMRDERDSLRKGRPVHSDARSRLERYVIGKAASGRRKPIAASTVACINLNALTETHLQQWLKHLPDTLAQSSKERLISDLKAALNSAYLSNRSTLPPDFLGVVRHGLAQPNLASLGSLQSARGDQWLSDAEVRALLRAAKQFDAERGYKGDLYRLLAVLAATGSRFSQVARLRVGDVQPERGRLLVPHSFKGRGRGKAGHTPVPVSVEIIEALTPSVENRASDDWLLERDHKERRSGGIVWSVKGRKPWTSAAELTRVWRDIRERAGVRPEIVPYAFRHSSIIRGLRANLPIRLVAAMHDTSVAIIESNYGRYIADGLEELASRAVVTLIAE